MLKQTIGAVLALSTFLLIGCDKAQLEPNPPRLAAGHVDAAPPAPQLPDPSVPAAASVLTPPASIPKTDVPGTRSNTTLTRAEESSAMPVAGQANDHSAPVSPAGRASAP